MSGFFEEVQRRKVYRVAAAYIVAAGFIIQIGSAVFPAWELPNWTFRLVVVLPFSRIPDRVDPGMGLRRHSAWHPRNTDVEHTRIASSAQCDHVDYDRRGHLGCSGFLSFTSRISAQGR
jgi:hypothetical protein